MAKLSANLSANLSLFAAKVSRDVACLWLLLADADSMLAAGGFYKGTTLQLEGNLSMIILSGLDLWSTISPMLTPWWQQGVASLRALLKRYGASR
jgi:hypothetical protein